MIERFRVITLFALYQLCLFVGILLLPIAFVAQRAGIPFPFHRLVRRLGEAYDGATAD